jgi:hypothetical protein
MSDNKPNLSLVLGAIDTRSKDVWDEFSDEEKKNVGFFLLNRYISNVESRDQDLVEHYLELGNEVVNKNFYILSKHPKLLWQLMCVCGYPTKKMQNHKWLALKRKSDGSSKKSKFLQTIYPEAKLDDIELMAKLVDTKELKQLAKDHGYSDKQINDLKL